MSKDKDVGNPSADGARDSVASSVASERSEKTLEPERNWRFTQWFKKMPVEDTLPDSDLLSAVEFDETGEFLATGDRGGRIVVLRSDETAKENNGKLHFKFHCEFQSHEAEFDYVRSQAIEEKINKIKWLPQTCSSQFMLTTNDRAIKLYQLQEKEIKFASGFNTTNDKGQARSPKKIKQLKLPKLETVETLVTATPKRFFAQDLHKFNIHSLCTSRDGETFLSADNLVINQWSLHRTDLTYQIINIKPEDMTTLTEVITAAETDSSNCHSLMYGTNRGVIRFADMRQKALCDHPSRSFVDPALEAIDKKAAQSGSNFANRPFLSDMLRSISDVKFSQGGRFIIARDFMQIKIWDAAMEKKPVEIIPVHEYLSPKLYDLYESEYLFDCFDLSVSQKGDILTGSYNNYFHVFDLNARSDTLIEASKPPLATSPLVNSSSGNSTGGTNPRDSRTKSVKKKRMSRPGIVSLLGRKKKSSKDVGKSNSEAAQAPVFADIDVHTLNYDKRILQLAWHPECNAIAVASENNLFLYSR